MNARHDIDARIGHGDDAIPVTAGPEHARAHWLAVLDALWDDLDADGAAGHSSVAIHDAAATLSQEPRVAWLMDVFGLDAIDVAFVLLAVAPELDPRFDALATTPWPGLVARSPQEQLSLRARLSPGHVLFRQRLLVPAMGSNHRDAWRGPGVTVDPQVLDALLYEDALDRRLARYCRLIEPAVDLRAIALTGAQWRPLVEVANRSVATRTALHLQFTGVAGSGRRHAAEALAQNLGLRLLVADLERLGDVASVDDPLAPLLREAWLREAVLYIEGIDGLAGQPGNGDLLRLLEALSEDAGIAILATPPGWLPPARARLCLHAVEFGDLDAGRRRTLWRRALLARGHDAQIDGLDALAYRFRLSPLQIERAVRDAEWAVQMRGGAGASLPLSLTDLLQAARDQAPRELAQLARKITPRARRRDLVLPEDSSRQLDELCQRVAFAPQVMDEWGFGARLSLGRGTSALFAGPSGTGKTMAAEIIAGELGLDLYKIDLATVVSKYIGETEKNLDRVFTAARNANAILFFDEADSIFGKRSEVRDSHDRYANLEVSYLLQKMEEYDGLALLSTNLKQNLDEAFLRRLTYIVLFPFPDSADRERIWRQAWPSSLVLADDVDLPMLAAEFKLAGGNIRNASLAAAYFAAADDGIVSMRHVVHGIRRELQKVGKTIGDYPRLAAVDHG